MFRIPEKKSISLTELSMNRSILKKKYIYICLFISKQCMQSDKCVCVHVCAIFVVIFLPFNTHLPIHKQCSICCVYHTMLSYNLLILDAWLYMGVMAPHSSWAHIISKQYNDNQVAHSRFRYRLIGPVGYSCKTPLLENFQTLSVCVCMRACVCLHERDRKRACQQFAQAFKYWPNLIT